MADNNAEPPDTYVLYRRESGEYQPPEDHICIDQDADEWLSPIPDKLDHLEELDYVEVLQWEYERDEDVFLTGPPEPIINADGKVALAEPMPDGQGCREVQIGKWECLQCGSVQGDQISVGEEPTAPHQCYNCERQGPFDPVGIADTDMNLKTVANPIWETPSSVSDARYSELWSEVRSYIKTYWFTDDDYLYDGLTAYAISTWLRPNYDFLPHLAVLGKFETGKSRLLNTLSNVSFRAIVPVDASPASVFRTIDAYDTTFYLSEFHDLIEETRIEINSLIKGAQKRNEVVLRAEAAGDQYDTRAFDVFTHVAVGTQFGLPDDTASRCIEVTTRPAEEQMPDLRDRPDLRNELLYARYRLLDSQEWDEAWDRADRYLARRGVTGRLREKLLSLVTVADLWNELGSLDEFIQEMAEHQLEVTSSSEDAAVVQAMMEVAFEELNRLSKEKLGSVDDPWKHIALAYNDIGEKYAEIEGNEMTNSRLGHIRKRLGLNKVRRSSGTYIAQPNLGEELKRLAHESGLEWGALEQEAIKDRGEMRGLTDEDWDPDPHHSQDECVADTIEIIQQLSTPAYAATLEDVLDEAESQGYDTERVQHVIDKLQQEGRVYEPGSGQYRTAN